jgi:hypothetical protein
MLTRCCVLAGVALLLLGCGGGETEEPDPAIAVDPNAPAISPEGPPAGVDLRHEPASIEADQRGALLD